MSEEANKRIGDYQILDELGSGGMGRVWRVRNVITDRIEAMKVLLPDLAGRQELAARFLREIKVMASLNHPNIAALRTAFTADNQLYMVMEYVEGTTLADKVERGPISVNDAVNYISQVLSAVSYAHQQHIIHRDIKPANMMLTPQGVVKLMDFGIARAGEERSLTMTGTTMGSLSYMSPEQVKGEATDGRSDLYSVGVSLYEFVTGQRPFTASSDYSIMAAHVKETPKPPVELHPGLPASLNEIILMAIAKDPGQRFQSADAFRNALSSVPVNAAAMTPGALDATTVDSILPLGSAPTPPAPTPARPVSVPVAAIKDARTPTAAPTPSPAPMPPPAQGSGHRGLYMTLGALIVLAGLVVAGIYVPRSSRTHAKGPDTTSLPQSTDNGSTNQVQPSQSVGSPSAAGTMTPETMPPPATPATTASVDNASPMQAPQTPTAAAPPATEKANSAKASRPQAKKLTAQSDAMPATPADSTMPPQGDSGMAAPAAAGNTANLDEMEHEIDQLSNRAAAVNSGLDRLQQEQSAAGYGLRGDMVERQASMKASLFKAEEAIQHGDAARAKRYADQTEKDINALERFLGH
jgi:serine/threonine protein kinase